MLRLLVVLALLPLPGSTPSPRPTPAPRVLEGWVKAPDGKAVEGATVTAWLSDERESAPLLAQTDASGRFRIVVVRQVPHTLRVEAHGFAPKTLGKARPGVPLTVLLGPGLVVEGVIRNGATGKPAAGVGVEARVSEGWTRGPTAWEPGPTATTDTTGHYRLEGLGRVPYDFAARGRGGLHAERHGVRPGANVDLVLVAGASLSGSVRDGSGRAVAGARIRLESERIFSSEAAVVVSNPQGRFDVTGLAPGVYRLVTLHPGFAPSFLPHLSVPTRGAARADVALGKGARILGRLLGPGGRAVGGAVAIATLEGEPTPSSLAPRLRAEAGDDGRFSLAAIPPGSHVLSVEPRGCAQKRVDVEVGAAELDLGDISLDVGLTIRGRVLNRTGAAVPEARITGSTRLVGVGDRLDTGVDPDGSFVLAGLNPGSVVLSVTAPGYAGLERTVAAGADNVVLVLEPGGAISGLVVDGSGKPVETYSVQVDVARRTLGRFEGSETPVDNSEGRFAVEDVAPGSYVVGVHAPGQSPAVLSDVEVTAGRTTDVGRVRLPSGGVIRGTVADTSGAPVPGATVSASDPRGPGSPPECESDASGAFELAGVPAGSVRLEARHPDFAPQTVQHILVDPARPAEVRVVLSSGGRVEGTVRERDGRGLGGLRVLVEGAWPPIATGNDGSFALDHVPAGHRSVAVLGPAGGGTTNLLTKDVDVVEGGVVAAELVLRDVRVSGTITRQGSPAGGLRVRARSVGQQRRWVFGSDFAPGPQRLEGLTQADGSYELLLGEPGPTSFTVATADDLSFLAERVVEIPDVDAYDLDFSIQGTPVSGVALDRQTREPILSASVVAGKKGGGRVAKVGADGRFELFLEPGDYALRVVAEGYLAEPQSLTVGADAISGLEFLLSAGLSIRGRVVDASGRGVAEVPVTARAEGSHGYSVTLADGTFSIAGLLPGPHCVAAQDRFFGRPNRFAAQANVSPEQGETTLALQTGGSLKVEVRGADGAPVKQAGIDFVGDVCPPEGTTMTDEQGVATLDLPQGTLEVRGKKGDVEGRRAVTMPEGGTMSVTLTLAPRGSGGPH